MNFDRTQVNSFDVLPDHLVLLVFNKVHDAKSLSFAMCVNKRFNSVIPEVDSVLLSIPNPTQKNSSRKTHEEKSLFKKIVVKPLNFILGFLKSSSSSSSQKSSSSTSVAESLPYEVLKPFKSLRSLEIKLPKSNLEMKGAGPGSNLLKWRAEFGSQIKSCVLVGATSIVSQDTEHQNLFDTNNEEGFKLRIMWSLSCLIAASARHVLAQKTLKDHVLTENLVIKDEDNQGLFSMNEEQIQELKKSMENDEEEEEGEGLLLVKKTMTKVPTLRMKMWYVPELALLESGKVMKGATLVVIKPVVVGGKKKAEECVDGRWVAEEFDDGQQGEEEEAEVFEEAIRELLKKEKCCVLEINSF